MKKTDLKNKTNKDLNKILADARVGLREFRFGLSGSKTKDIKKGRTLRKETARTLTELNFRKNSIK
ncbi:50S ribosomal protein L29 [Patescibacteria group bacterium]|nr:50S ribosomal protein L29 [Patescibacteria group bacterium]